MASVSLEGVTKRYREVVAVDDLDLEIIDGEFMMLLGPSGCGKTTALRLIAGLELPDGGTVRFDGRDMEHVLPAERNVAMVFEGYALFPHMAVRENLSFALRLRHTPSAEVDRRVADVAEAMELDHLLQRRPPGLATGEAQHVAVGRAVVRDTPAVLLLDDALSHLDARQRLEARAEVARLHDDLGCTIVSVTHDQAEALAIGTRVAIMDQGVLMQLGTPQEIWERPANTFVADFIGDPPMNLLPAELFGITDEPGVTVGVRPEQLRIGPSDDETSLSGRCELVEFLGPRTLLHLRNGDHVFKVLDEGVTSVTTGDLVECHASPASLHRFDTASGRALEGRSALV